MHFIRSIRLIVALQHVFKLYMHLWCNLTNLANVSCSFHSFNYCAAICLLKSLLYSSISVPKFMSKATFMLATLA